MTQLITRRRSLCILAGMAGGMALTTSSVSPRFVWEGIALGADARIVFDGASRDSAEEAVAACLAEVERLEGIFSLFDANSEIVRLNAEGRIRAPSLDLVMLLKLSRHLHHLTEGLFDPTVQPLWRHYADLALGLEHAASSDIAPFLARIGMERVAIDADEISLPPAMQITLNGIAQGYITDRVADLLRARGWSRLLIDLGEVRALEGKTFESAVRNSSGTISLTGAALATSATDGTLIGPGAGVSHVLEPATGRPAHIWRTVTVRHASAAIADGLSTALLLADRPRLSRIAGRLSATAVWAT